jgi:hypothetical protein
MCPQSGRLAHISRFSLCREAVGGPSLMYAADAISSFEQFEKQPTAAA